MVKMKKSKTLYFSLHLVTYLYLIVQLENIAQLYLFALFLVIKYTASLLHEKIVSIIAKQLAFAQSEFPLSMKIKIP